MRSVPLLGDIALESAQLVEHTLDGGFVALPVAGLDGDVQQRLSRRSHRLRIAGTLWGEEAASQLETLQQAAAEGEELTFAADISTALDLQRVVIEHFHAVELGGHPGCWQYDLRLAESPPLPPPAEVSGFGGLGDLGLGDLGDLGFDTDLLGDLADLAGEVAGAIDEAMAVMEQLEGLAALANLGDLAVGDLFSPLQGPLGELTEVGGQLSNATTRLLDAFS